MKNATLAMLLCAIVGLTLVWPSTPSAQAGQQPAGQGGGRGAAAGGGRGGAMQHAKGTLTPKATDPGRPWGWAVRAFMDNPNQKLYNTAKQKLLDGKQIFSHTISRPDADAYCQQAPHYDFT